MELLNSHYKPQFTVTFTFEEINELFAAAASHYDARCRTFAAPLTTAGIGYAYTQHGYSFLTGLKSRILNGTADRPGVIEAHYVDFEILDTLGKIAESPRVSDKTAGAIIGLLKAYKACFDFVNRGVE